MVLNTYFERDVREALAKKMACEEHMRYVCGHLKRYSPNSHNWYYNGNGFVYVDIDYDEFDDYARFIEGMVDCRYTYVRNLGGVTLMLSLSTLLDCLEKKKDRME